MKTEQHERADADEFELQLREGLERLASTTDVHTPRDFDPELLPLAVTEPPRRRVVPVVAAAAVAAVIVAGLVMIDPTDEPAGSNAPAATQAATPSVPAFRFETPTVRLEAGSVEVITAAGAFAPTADVTVYGDPGMPDEYTTLELT